MSKVVVRKRRTPAEIQADKDAKLEASKIVKPVVRFDDQEHVLERLFKDKEAPEIVSVGLVKLTGATSSGWVSCVMKSQGDRITSIEVSVPDIKSVAYDAAKISFVNNFLDSFEA